MTTGDRRQPIEQFLDVFVYAPIGLAVSAKELLPELVEKGRARVTGQVQMARVVGEYAAQQGRQEIGRRVEAARQQAVDRLEQVTGPDDAPVVPPAPAPPVAANGTAAAPTAAPLAGDLAIPDYDSLAASQVVSRLTGLGPGELEAVRAYEAHQRGRKTILNKIAQLQKG